VPTPQRVPELHVRAITDFSHVCMLWPPYVDLLPWYLARCARQRRCREAPSIAAGEHHTLFVDETGRLLVCGRGTAVGHGEEWAVCSAPTPVAAMAGIRVRSLSALGHSLALGWDGRVYSWGCNGYGQLGHGDRRYRPSPALVEGLKDVCSVAVGAIYSLAVTQAGAVFQWGTFILRRVAECSNQPIIVSRLDGVRIRRVCAGKVTAFAIGEPFRATWPRRLAGPAFAQARRGAAGCAGEQRLS
jgi:alpha-tubulin suppressor-like RCC1 family protein